MRMPVEREQRFGTVLLTALCILSYSAAAQSGSRGLVADLNEEGGRMGSRTNVLSLRVAADYSAVAARDVSFNGASGHSGAQSVRAGIAAAVPLDEHWFIPFGLASHNLFLGTLDGVPIPDQVHTLGFNAGLGYRLNDRWTVAGSLGPRLYRLDDLDSSDIGVGGNVRATYKALPNLLLALGLNFNPDRNVPVLPAAGLRWGMRTNLTLNLMFPRTDLEYRVLPRLKVFADFDANFTVFRAENDFGDRLGQPQFNNALATYRDFRLGLGAEYRLVQGLSATLEGGYSFARAIDYKELDQTVKFGSAPYVQVGLRWRF